MAIQKHYYISGHTGKGYVNYLKNNLEGINMTLLMKGASVQISSQILSYIIQLLKDKYMIEIIYSPKRKDAIAGIILRNQGKAIISESIVAEEMTFNHRYVIKSDVSIEQSREHDGRYEQAYDYFKQGLVNHDRHEQIYIQEMDFIKANNIIHMFTDDLLKGIEKIAREPKVYHRLFGTNTLDGIVNQVDKIIPNYEKVYHIKGRAGTGKSHFMKKVFEACIDHGLDCELYHCSFDPDSLDMLIVPWLDFCIFDSTAPHEFLPKHTNEHVIDLYELTVTAGTDERYAEQIKPIMKKHRYLMNQGLETLNKLKEESNVSMDKEEAKKHANKIIQKLAVDD